MVSIRGQAFCSGNMTEDEKLQPFSVLQPIAFAKHLQRFGPFLHHYTAFPPKKTRQVKLAVTWLKLGRSGADPLATPSSGMTRN